MSCENIENCRRQKFMYSPLYENCRKSQIDGIEIQKDNICLIVKNPKKGLGSNSHCVAQHFLYRETLWLWILDYTAGIKLEDLAPRLTEIVDLFVEWFLVGKIYTQRLQQDFGEELDPNAAAVDFDNILEYEDTMQLLSIALMLRDQVSIFRIIDCLKFYRGQDALFEQLILDYVSDGVDMEKLIHDEPYQLLLQVYYEEDKEKGLDLLQQYLKIWYQEMAGARWYDAHRKIVDDNAPYYGYWAFEAGATAFLLSLDDSQIDHMVYPKDLVAYAKKLRAEDRYTSKKGDVLKPTQYRVEAGLACTRTGHWYTPAKQNSRTHFKQGDVMPDFPDSSYGATIWYWDQNQD